MRVQLGRLDHLRQLKGKIVGRKKHNRDPLTTAPLCSPCSKKPVHGSDWLEPAPALVAGSCLATFTGRAGCGWEGVSVAGWDEGAVGSSGGVGWVGLGCSSRGWEPSGCRQTD